MPYAERKRFSQAMRALVAFEQDYKCAVCNGKLPMAWQLDHVVPLCDPSWAQQYPNSRKAATAAANRRENLQSLCNNCHGAKSLVEVSEPGLAAPARPPKPRGIPWAAARLRQRSRIDAIWAMASTNDRLTELLTAETVWPRLVSASSAADYRKIHREVVKQGRRIDYEGFMRRVDHLLAS